MDNNTMSRDLAWSAGYIELDVESGYLKINNGKTVGRITERNGKADLCITGKIHGIECKAIFDGMRDEDWAFHVFGNIVSALHDVGMEDTK